MTSRKSKFHFLVGAMRNSDMGVRTGSLTGLPQSSLVAVQESGRRGDICNLRARFMTMLDHLFTGETDGVDASELLRPERPVTARTVDGKYRALVGFRQLIGMFGIRGILLHSILDHIDYVFGLDGGLANDVVQNISGQRDAFKSALRGYGGFEQLPRYCGSPLEVF